jgi:hypothetical protein
MNEGERLELAGNVLDNSATIAIFVDSATPTEALPAKPNPLGSHMRQGVPRSFALRFTLPLANRGEDVENEASGFGIRAEGPIPAHDANSLGSSVPSGISSRRPDSRVRRQLAWQ